MKRIGKAGLLLTLWMLLLALAAGGALAEGTAVPADVQENLKSLTGQGYAITDWQTLEGEGWGFAVLQQADSGKNLLYVYRRNKSGEWKRYTRSDGAVFQGKKQVKIQVLPAGVDHVLAKETQSVKTPVFQVMQMSEDGEYAERWIEFTLYRGQWLLTWWEDINDCAVRVKSGELRYYGNWWNGYDFKGSVKGTVQRDLRYAGVSLIPRSLSSARSSLTTAPDIPRGTLNAQEIQFTGGQKFEVYSGPGEYYVRGANGKALVSTNDWMQVFGRENGWIMIQYAISRDHMRIGWIPESALPAKAEVYDLRFDTLIARVTRQSVLTDDPLFSAATLRTLEEGSEVIWMATMGDWAYVEVAGTEMVRGFVPARYLEVPDPAADENSRG